MTNNVGGGGIAEWNEDELQTHAEVPHGEPDEAGEFDDGDAELLAELEIDSVFRNGAGKYQVESVDSEISGQSDGRYMSREDSQKLLPAPFRNSPEGKMLFNYIRRPSTDITQIRQRQRLIDLLRDPVRLPKLLEMRMGCYEIDHGIGTLLSYTEDDWGNKTSVLSAYRQGKGSAAQMGAVAVRKIMTGKECLGSLIVMLREFQNPFMDQVTEKLERLRTALDPISPSYLKSGDSGFRIVRTLGRLQGNFQKNFLPVAMFMEFANVSMLENFARASFDPTQALEYKGGWNLYREREAERDWNDKPKGKAQVVNDSPKEHPLVVYTGSNMSGKSFELKKVFYMQLLAQSFGYAPCEEGNFEMYDSFHYLDRAATDTSRDLSAFGKEIMDWKKAIADFGERPFICCDEGFSTTSPQDQYRLLTAVDLFLRGKRARVFLATHNEAFILRNVSNQNVGLYHLKTNVDAAGKVEYHHELLAGPSDSMALQVAKSLGLPDEVLQMAERYLAGEFPSAQVERKPQCRKLRKYSEGEREKLKGGTKMYYDLFPGGRGKNTMLQLFSEDKDFQSKFGGSSVHTGAPSLNHRALRPFMSIESSRNHSIHDFLFHLEAPSAEAAYERQQLFSALASRADFHEMHERDMNFQYTIYFLRDVLGSAVDYTRFNLVLAKYGHDRWRSYEQADEFFAFLELNEALLGDAFPLGDDLARMRELMGAGEKYQQEAEYRTLTDIQHAEMQVLNEPFDASMQEVTSRVIENFGKKYSEKYPDHPLPDAPYTLSNLKHFCVWLGDNYYIDHEGRDTTGYADMMQLRDYFKGNIIRPIEKNETFEEDFLRIAAQYSEKDSEKWQGKVTQGRVKALFHTLSRDDDFRYSVEAQTLQRILSTLTNHQHYLSLVSLDGKAMDYHALQESISDFMRETQKRVSSIPAVSLFNDGIDMDHIRPFVMRIIDPLISRMQQDVHAERLEQKEIFAMSLKTLFHEQDAVKSYLDWMRSFDSVYMQQIANTFEEAMPRLWQGFEWGDLSKKPFVMPRSGKAMVDLLKKHYLKGLEDRHAELCTLEQNETGILALGHGYYKPNHFDTLSPKYPYEYYTLAEECLAGKRTWNQNRDFSPEYATIFVQWAMTEKYGLDGARRAQEFTQAHGGGYIRDLDMYMRQFFSKEFPDKVQILEKFSEMRKRRNALGEKAEAHRAKYNIRFQDDKVHLDTQGGRISGLRAALDQAIKKNIEVQIGKVKFPNASYQSQDVFGTLYDLSSSVSALVIMAEMIRTQGHVPVKFNTTGEVRMDGAWNLSRPKSNQVASGVEFSGEERVKLINGANMSGKTFWLKKSVFALQWAMATGYAPAEFATMPLLDRVIYLDRVRAKSDNNLSAFGNEITFWNDYLKLITRDEGAATISFLDEIFSTTSPKYQAALGAALLAYASQHGSYSALASHHHEMIDRFVASHPAEAAPYHFSGHTVLAEDGGVKLVPDYHLQRGHVGSQALEVARSLGFSEEILKIAELMYG